MIEKALLLACIAVVLIIGISAVGSSLSRMMTKTECAWSGKTLCIINNPNQTKM